MSASTSPDNIVYPTSTDSFGPLETVFATLATSVQTALSATKTYRTADLTSLAAIAGMASSALATVTEGGATFGYDGTLWQQKTEALFANTTIRDSAYAKAGGAYKISPNARVVVAGVRQEWNTLGWSPVGGNDLYLSLTRANSFTMSANSTNYVLGGAGSGNPFFAAPTSSSALTLVGSVYSNELFSWSSVSSFVSVKVAGTYEIEFNVSATLSGSGGSAVIGIVKNGGTIGGTTNDLARCDGPLTTAAYLKARNPGVALGTGDAVYLVGLMSSITGTVALGANPMDGTFRIRRIGA